ncbi:hypothetical protein FisN_8Hh194 [Fistulifera solaris]|uniref:Uncharacterized protein n=1 Tax=Fistulifera solaris TaxID=1519565 RepID=A0A1Z5JY67_FISSO|nr:hypothetical protein FisN_8Hh194 [Fistulifera solaris]|eukprot:GAX18973.1 hypothetical protein FisN_8Hh194 [Fistulifera solaris]
MIGDTPNDSHPPKRTKRRTIFISLFAIAAFSSCRLRGAFTRGNFDFLLETGNKRYPFWGAFPNVETVERLLNFTDLSDLVQLHNLPVPRNLNILFMGDSLSRYQYLDLVYFLSHNGTWPSPDETPNMVLENTHKHGWVQFFNFTNAALRPYEQCDCFRLHSAIKAVENRYFYDAERNNSVTYLQKFGMYPFKSSWNVTDVYNEHELVQLPSGLSFVHKDLDWADAIRDFVCRMSPKPSVFIFNAGIWADHDLVNVEMQQRIVDALQECQIVSMYKTTTKMTDQRNQTWDEYEQQLCKLTDHCMDLRWTAIVPEEHYWDTKHFREPIYSMMNVQLLSLLTSSNLIETYETIS